MPDLRDISIGSRYTGDPNLGGPGFGVLQIDTRPLQLLAQYTFEYNRVKWDAEQKELEKMAKESAEFAEYDLTNAIPKYAKHVRDKYDEIFAWSQANPDVKSYSKNPKGYNEWRKKLNELGNDILDGASQEIIYKAATANIEAAKTPEEKAELTRQRDEEVAEKDIRTPLTIHKYNAVPSKIPEIPIKTFDFTKRGANGLIAQRKFKAADQAFVVSQAFLNANNMQGETGEDFSNMPEDVRKLKIKEAKMRKATGRNAEVDQAIIITEALQDKSLRDENGKIDLKKVSESSNPITSGLIEGMIKYNQIMDEELALIDQGAYSDNLGVLIPGVKGMKRNDYKKIDFSDGEITAYDLLLVKYRANAPATTWETETKELNNPLQAAQLAETIRHNKVAENLNKGELKLNQDKWKASQVGGETQINGAMERAKRIYNDMKKLADKNGVIPPDKIRQLNVEQRKYLGLESLTTVKDAEGNDVTDANGNVVTKPGLKPLDLSGDTKYAIQLINGEIKVLANAELIKDDAQGRYSGLFDNTRSTNINNVGTNILNEELKNAGAKELNAYLPIDVTGAPPISTSTSGGASSTSGTSKQIINGYEIPEGATVVYSKKTGKALGYTLNGKNYQF